MNVSCGDEYFTGERSEHSPDRSEHRPDPGREHSPDPEHGEHSPGNNAVKGFGLGWWVLSPSCGGRNFTLVENYGIKNSIVYRIINSLICPEQHARHKRIVGYDPVRPNA